MFVYLLLRVDTRAVLEAVLVITFGVVDVVYVRISQTAHFCTLSHFAIFFSDAAVSGPFFACWFTHFFFLAFSLRVHFPRL